MPSRVIKGEINASDSLSRVSIEAELTFRAILLACDDYGRFDGRTSVLKAALFPLRDEMDPKRIEACVAELWREGCIVRFVNRGRPYLACANWERHRAKGRRGTTSKYPDPADATSEILGTACVSEELNARVGDRCAGDEARCAGNEERGAGVQTPSASVAAEPATLAKPAWTWLVPMLAARSPVGTERDEIEAWLSEMWPEIAARGEAEAPTPAKEGATIRSIAHARFRAYLGGPRPLRGISERRAHEARIDLWERERGAAARDAMVEEAKP